jgi:hypothetical protein
MNLYTMLGKPYYKLYMFRTDRGDTAIDAHFNIHFIYELDNIYAQAGSDYYDVNLEDQAKVAIYAYDTIGNIADKYMPLEELIYDESDIAADVPAMGSRGGEEVRQVVDLADRPQSTSPLDVKMG